MGADEAVPYIIIISIFFTFLNLNIDIIALVILFYILYYKILLRTKIAMNNGTLGVQNDTHTHSSSNNNTSILIATSGGSIIVKSEVISRQAAHISKNSDDAYG